MIKVVIVRLMEKVLFSSVIILDMDGVLNKFSEETLIDKRLLSNLKEIVDETGADLVLSSDWRHDPELKRLAIATFLENGLKIIDETPYISSAKRSEEIKEWLKMNHYEKFAIIDDCSDAGYGFENDFFQTKPNEGITDDVVKNVVCHLSGER